MNKKQVRKCIKGMDANMKCRDFQFEEGKTYFIPEDEVKICNNGFHAIDEDECPLSVFDYYPPCDKNGVPNRYFEAEIGGNTEKDGEKICGSKIKIGAEIGIPGKDFIPVEWVDACEMYGKWKIVKQEQPDYKEAVQLVFEEELTPFKDGNQWCFLLGRNIQDGICGFGDTILDAAVAFYKDYTNTRIHIGELKISMTQQEQPEVDLEKEIDRWFGEKYIQNMEGLPIKPIVQIIARHFWNKGYNARK